MDELTLEELISRRKHLKSAIESTKEEVKKIEVLIDIKQQEKRGQIQLFEQPE